MIQFSCSSCGKQYQVKPELGGRKTKCLTCSNPIVVPVVSDVVSEVVVAEIDDSRNDGTIEFSLGFFPLGWFLFFCTPVVVVNGIPARQNWGTHRFEMPPGTYEAKIFVPYLFWPECAANSVNFELRPGEHRRVSFYMWPWVYAKGSMSVT